ncbi:MAG: hypothetical protein ACI4EQ_00495 [Lachnospiraceae bacterium]
MEIKCPNCVAALVFDATSGKMQCKYCGSFFTMADIEDQMKEAEEAQSEKETENDKETDTMQCNIYACTSCGAELAVNGVETSTFCAYCGQPTIVFSRVSETLKPEVIIPFAIQKQQAVNAIRSRFNRGYFIPKEVKEFEVDRVRGIYIPYWLFDSYYYDRQLIKGTVGSGKSSRTKYFMREADCQFSKVSLDASANLSDDSSQRLEPYDMRGLREFEIGYMSGYYSDRYDRSKEDLRGLAAQRTKELFDGQMMESCNARSKSVVVSNPQIQIQKETYAMLPAWFMTFRYKENPYTMLVNGQTGKVVGAVPYDSVKVKTTAIAIFLLTLIISIPLGIAFCTAAFFDGESLLKMFVGAICLMGVMVSVGFGNLKKLRRSETLTASQKMNRYAHERQEEGGDFR